MEVANPTPPRMLTLTVSDANNTAELAATRFAPDNAGSFLDNINRWRGQLGLDPVADANTVERKDIKLAGEVPGIELEFHNPQVQKRMLVVITSPRDGGDLWFFKLTGPADLVANQKENFESFMKSVEFKTDAANP